MGRYNYACTFVSSNPGIALAPAPDNKVMPKYAVGTGNNVSTASSLGGTLQGEDPRLCTVCLRPLHCSSVMASTCDGTL